MNKGADYDIDKNKRINVIFLKQRNNNSINQIFNNTNMESQNINLGSNELTQASQSYYTLEEVAEIKANLLANVTENIKNLITDTFVIADKQHPKALQSFGQVAVGTSFNPSHNPDVDFAKQLMALSIDLMRKSVGKGGGKARHANTAITLIEGAQMRMIKAITWDGE